MSFVAECDGGHTHFVVIYGLPNVVQNASSKIVCNASRVWAVVKRVRTVPFDIASVVVFQRAGKIKHKNYVHQET